MTPPPLRFDNKVAVITGAGCGLGRSHALLLGSLGARVVVNDLGGDAHGHGADTKPAEQVAAEIRRQGGKAVANFGSVEQGERLIEQALDCYGGIDIVINNAGILRDRSFHKMSHEDWQAVIDVHLEGAYRVTRAAWPHLREQRYGRVIFTSSAAGIYGNYGQANYSAAKLGLYGLTQTLAVEGRSHNILVNAIAPMAASRLTESLMPPELNARLKPELVSPLVAWLCHEQCEESGGLFEAGAGWFGKLRWQRADGIGLPVDRPITPGDIASHWAQITDFDHAHYPDSNVEAVTRLLANLKNSES